MPAINLYMHAYMCMHTCIAARLATVAGLFVAWGPVCARLSTGVSAYEEQHAQASLCV